ncbi:MAG: hypothetical protein ACJ716_07825 [Marmoricola sp.]
MRGLLLLVLVVLVNLPAVNEGWNKHEVATKGHDVTALVIDARELNGRYLVDYRLPEAADPEQTRFSASIDEATYLYAKSSDSLRVRMLSGEPGSNRPEGLVESSLFKVIAIAGDLVLALIAAIAWYRRRHPGDMPDPRPRPVGL